MIHRYRIDFKKKMIWTHHYSPACSVSVSGHLHR